MLSLPHKTSGSSPLSLKEPVAWCSTPHHSLALATFAGQLMFNRLKLSVFSRLCSRCFEALDSYIATREREKGRDGYGKLDGERRSGVHLIKQRSLYWTPRLLALLIRGRKWSERQRRKQTSHVKIVRKSDWLKRFALIINATHY